MNKKNELETTIKSIQARRASAEIFQLKFWPEAKRGVPNSFLRSALFAAIQGKDRVSLVEAVLASQNGITVKFTGKQLNQDDLTVWLTLVHLAREHPLGTHCDFTAYSLLKEMGMSTGKSQYKQLHSSVVRLVACAIEVTHMKKTYGGNLIQSFKKDEITSRYQITINKEMIKLFGEAQWTELDWEQRKLLRNMPLALALHAHYSSHNKPFSYKLETLAEYMGSTNKDIYGFKRQLQKAFESLVRVGFLSSFKIDNNNLVTVYKHRIQDIRAHSLIQKSS